MTNTANYTHWECSSAWEQFYAEMRDHVAKQLGLWGVNGGNAWPDRARVNKPSLVKMTPAWFSQIVSIGNRGIRLAVDKKNMPAEVQATIDAEGQKHYILDCYFVEAMPHSKTSGRMRAPSLTCYIPLLFHVCVVQLGCTHQYATRDTNPITSPIATVDKYECPECNYKWEVDRGD